MKFIIDENLPPRLAAWLRERGHDTVHVLDAGLSGHADADIISLALQEQRAIVTQDSDFDDARGVNVLRLALGNASTPALLTWLEPHFDAACARLNSGQRLVVLS